MNANAVELNGLRVLAVDDDVDTLDIVTILFEEYGVEVIRATSAKEALELITQLKPDILLADIAMPGEDGYSLIRKVRTLEIEQGGQIPAIALTASADDNGAVCSIQAGFQNHVAKPFDFVELVATVASLAKRRNSI
jgi:hypothetical protein